MAEYDPELKSPKEWTLEESCYMTGAKKKFNLKHYLKKIEVEVPSRNKVPRLCLN